MYFFVIYLIYLLIDLLIYLLIYLLIDLLIYLFYTLYMKIFIDIDNTIFKTIGNDYKNSQPIPERIEKANKLYNDGHIITYWTARGCTSGKTAEYFKLTYSQLVSSNVQFHELRMGKPHFDLFIDDKNINAIDGWTHANVEKILDFNRHNDSLRND